MTIPTPLAALLAIPANAPLQDPSVAAVFAGLFSQLAPWSLRIATLINNFMKGQLPGTSTNDNATAGNVGEYVSSIVLTPGVNLSNNIAANITSVSLMAGDWDVDGEGWIAPAGSTTITAANLSINTGSATLATGPADGTSRIDLSCPGTAGAFVISTTGPARLSLASTTTVYLVTAVAFGVSTCTAYGIIRARRVR